ncbi:hypothetical protein SFRURICE_009828 [Spodoptera frugiperda]|nr:hypothetical protein SFRURICE_009828 [Spodoptera frugiperda]
MRTIKSATVMPKFTCGLCSRSYSNYKHLLEHMYWRHGTESFCCKQCTVKRWRFAPHLCHVLPIDVADNNMNSEGPAQETRESEYCYCGKDIPDSPMIGCDGPNCQFSWFHYTCVGVITAPKGDWFCPTCIKLKAKKGTVKSATAMPKFTCGLCSRSYSNYKHMLEHMYWRHGTESFCCKQCTVKRWRFAPHLCHVLPIDVADNNMNSEGPTQETRESEYCYCGKDIPDSPMIGCDGPNCQFSWFHYTCVGVITAPKGDWFCPTCIKLKAKKGQYLPKFTCGLYSRSYSNYKHSSEHMYWRHGTESFWCKQCTVKRWRFAPHLCHVLPIDVTDNNMNLEGPTQETRESEFCYCGKNIPDSLIIVLKVIF